MGEHEDEARAHERRRRFFVRAAIFITLGAVAQATAALPPGPAEPSFYWASLAVFCVCALSVLPPWRRLPPWGVLWPTLGYLVSVALLLISGGTNPSMQSTAGGLSVLLLPVLATALSYPRWYSVVVVAGAAFTLTVVGVAVQGERGHRYPPHFPVDRRLRDRRDHHPPYRTTSRTGSATPPTSPAWGAS